MRNAQLEGRKIGTKTAERNIITLQQADNIILLVGSEHDITNLLLKTKRTEYKHQSDLQN